VAKLDLKIEYLPSVGPKVGKKLEKLGIKEISDLFYYFPRRYEDFSAVIKIQDLAREVADNWQNQLSFSVSGQILGISNKKTRRRGFTVTEGVIADQTGTLKVVWFNQPFLQKMLKTGSEIIFRGKVNFDSFSQDYVMEAPLWSRTRKIVPVYPETAGVSSFFISKLFSKASHFLDGIEEFLPAKVLIKYGLLDLKSAILKIHNPNNSEELKAAQRRFAFEELFLISLKSALTKEERRSLVAPSIEVVSSRIEQEIAGLPFKLTNDQTGALLDIAKDLRNKRPMSRLLNGDVGSGKTIVAILAALFVKEAGFKTLFMVPTSILAGQHYETFKRLFGSRMNIGLWTSERKELSVVSSQFTVSDQLSINKFKTDKLIEKCKLKIANCDVIVGTQALIQKGVEIDDVGLVVVDEQHRFGVGQRAALSEISHLSLPITHLNEKFQKVDPHFLSMTATPIPRTLHLALFGDLDISLIKEKPENRREIKTRFVESFNREKAYEFIREHFRHGRQAFVICPLIEQAEGERLKAESLFEEDRKSVASEFEKLKKVFPEFKIAMLHGKMKAKEKDQIMTDFALNQTQLLVSTSVVEVGVDVPNATIMMIEDAEHFGLAQVHQFRGRVGRGEHQSFCFLFSSSQSEKSLNRLRSLESTSDGFKLAEIDLETRGPGVIFGTDQSGMLSLKMASYSDYSLIKIASEAAKECALKISTLPLLQQKLDNFIHNSHLE